MRRWFWLCVALGFASPVNGSLASGRRTVSFDAAGLPSGLYIYRIEANGFTDQKKMLLMK